MNRFLMWLVWHVPLGRLAPWVLGLAIGGGKRTEVINNTNICIHKPFCPNICPCDYYEVAEQSDDNEEANTDG